MLVLPSCLPAYPGLCKPEYNQVKHNFQVGSGYKRVVKTV